MKLFLHHWSSVMRLSPPDSDQCSAQAAPLRVQHIELNVSLLFAERCAMLPMRGYLLASALMSDMAGSWVERDVAA